jgi:hypothetical protein
MNKKAFYLVAVILALVSFITNIAARSSLDDAMHRKAARFEQVEKQQVAYTPDPQALQSSRDYRALTRIGAVFTVLSVVCMVTAMFRHEQARYMILILILILSFDVFIPLLL